MTEAGITVPVWKSVMGFCTDDEYNEFLYSCPEFEKMLIRSRDYPDQVTWFSVSEEIQEKRIMSRINDPLRSWKLSQMDVESRDKWDDYSKAKDIMFAKTSISEAPWYVINADNKKLSRLNCISHLLTQIPYEDIVPTPFDLPERKKNGNYKRPPKSDQNFVPERYKLKDLKT